jgi:hypothetical protein
VPLIAASKVDPERQRGWNPLAAHSAAAAGSSYLGPSDGVLKHLLDPDRRPSAAELALHHQLLEQVLGEGYPCVGAAGKSAACDHHLSGFCTMITRGPASLVQI